MEKLIKKIVNSSLKNGVKAEPMIPIGKENMTVICNALNYALQSFISVVAETVVNRINERHEESSTPKYMTREQAARALNISLPTLKKYTEEGVLQSKRLGGRVLYDPDDIKQALNGIDFKCRLQNGGNRNEKRG